MHHAKIITFLLSP